MESINFTSERVEKYGSRGDMIQTPYIHVLRNSIHGHTDFIKLKSVHNHFQPKVGRKIIVSILGMKNLNLQLAKRQGRTGK